MPVSKTVKAGQVRTAAKTVRSVKYFDTISPRKTCYLMRQVNHVSDKADLFLKKR